MAPTKQTCDTFQVENRTRINIVLFLFEILIIPIWYLTYFKQMLQRNHKKACILLATLLLLSSCQVFTEWKKSQSQRVRRFKARPINRKQSWDQHGHFASLVNDMLNKERDFEQYFKYTWMTPDLFNYLLEIVQSALQKDVTKNLLSPAHRLTMTLKLDGIYLIV